MSPDKRPILPPDPNRQARVAAKQDSIRQEGQQVIIREIQFINEGLLGSYVTSEFDLRQADLRDRLMRSLPENVTYDPLPPHMVESKKNPPTNTTIFEQK